MRRICVEKLNGVSFREIGIFVWSEKSIWNERHAGILINIAYNTHFRTYLENQDRLIFLLSQRIHLTGFFYQATFILSLISIQLYLFREENTNLIRYKVFQRDK